MNIKLKSIALIIFLSGNILIAQNENSIFLSGGIVFPRSSSNGFALLAEYDYQLNSNISIYISTGYSNWDKFTVVYQEDATPTQNQQYFATYSSDNHILVPVCLGVKINIHTNKLFTSFINFEAGYSYFKYNQFANVREVNSEGDVIAYSVDPSSKEKVEDHLFGIGFGGGFFHKLTENINFVIQYKINSNFNSGNFGLFSAKGTYSTLLAGLNIGI